jgi:hypothetical protein
MAETVDAIVISVSLLGVGVGMGAAVAHLIMRGLVGLLGAGDD